MSYPVIAIHAVVCTPEGEKKQVQVAPGKKFSVTSKEEYEYLKSVGAVKDDESAKKAPAAADAKKPADQKKPAAGDVIG